MTMSLGASVIVRTYNRASYLSICLDALAAQTADRTTFEIIVVDNNSTDDTQDVVQGFARSHPTLRVRYVLETRRGTSYANNCGVLAASGEILCFTDDDAAPSPGWLKALIETFADADVGCAGGPIELDYQGQERPPWFQGSLQGLLSGRKLPYDEPTPLSSITEFPFGCNMAFRRSVFADLGLFRTDLGPSGGRRLVGEETEMIERVHSAGWNIMYLPDASVRHLVPPERLRKSYIYRAGWALAASHVILTRDHRPHMVARWFASDMWYATRLFFKLATTIIRRRRFWFDDYIPFWIVVHRIPIRANALVRGHLASKREPPGWHEEQSEARRQEPRQ